MELEYNLYALLETVGFVQAITLGSLLMLLHKKEHKSSFFLGLFLVLFALETIPIILESTNAYAIYPEFYLLPFDFFWLHFPIFYIYTQQVSIFHDSETKYWVLYPGLIAFLVQLFVFFLPYETKLAITQNVGYEIYNYCKIVYGLSIGIYTLLHLGHHKIEVHNYFSMVKNKELNWARIFLVFNIAGSISYSIISRTISGSMFSEIFFLIFDLTLVYWASYHGVQQRNVISLLGKLDDYGIPRKNSIVENNLPNGTDKDMSAMMEKIHEHIVQLENFINPDLTIIELAEKLKVHPKRISTTINTVKKQNFNAYVNHYRIKKAESLLKNIELHNLSIEGIGNEVGFHSKSAFYSAFKKETGTTPLQYKERVAA